MLLLFISFLDSRLLTAKNKHQDCACESPLLQASTYEETNLRTFILLTEVPFTCR